MSLCQPTPWNYYFNLEASLTTAYWTLVSGIYWSFACLLIMHLYANSGSYVPFLAYSKLFSLPPSGFELTSHFSPLIIPSYYFSADFSNCIQVLLHETFWFRVFPFCCLCLGGAKVSQMAPVAVNVHHLQMQTYSWIDSWSFSFCHRHSNCSEIWHQTSNFNFLRTSY